MKKIIVVSLIALSIIHYPLSISAQDSTDSAQTSDEVKKSVKERLEKAAKEEGSVLGENSKKAYVGTVESLTQNTITVKTNLGSKQVTVAEKAKIIGKNRETLKTDDLEIGSNVIVMGFTTDKDVLDGRRIVVTDKPLSSDYTPYLTTITKIAKSIITTQAGELKLTKDTKITQTFEDNQTEIESSDLKVDDSVIILGKPDTKKASVLETIAIHLPQGRAIITTPTASPSASADL